MSKTIKTLSEARAEVERLEGEATALQSTIAERDATIAEQAESITALEGERDTAAAERDEAKTSAATANTERDTANADLEKVNADLAAVNELIGTIGIKPDAEAKDNRAALEGFINSRAAARAQEIVAAQGGDTPLETDGACGGPGGKAASDDKTDLSPEARIRGSVRIAN